MTPPYFPEMDESLGKATKPITFAHYMKSSLEEYPLPGDYKPTKKQIADNQYWYKNF